MSAIACYCQNKSIGAYRWLDEKRNRLRIADGWSSVKTILYVDGQCQDCHLRDIGETIAGVVADQKAKTA